MGRTSTTGAGRTAAEVSWGRRSAIATVVAVAIALVGGVAPATASEPAEETVEVIVRRTPGSALDLDRLVEATGGEVRQDLGIIEGVAAEVPASAVAELEAVPDVVEVTPDAELTLDAGPRRTTGWERRSTALDFVEEDFGRRHGGSSFADLTTDHLARVTGADRAWRWATGRGIDVALIDSGVVPVPGMGAVVNGPDLSFDSQNPDLLHLDAYGHGTHLAGLINGDGQGVHGLAPDARVLNVKVGAANGAVDVSQVIAAIDWVVQHKDDPGLNVRVLALAFGTDGVQDHRLDPLSYAVEVAWHHGIVVVVAGGNRGASVPILNNPATNPFVIAVGASEPHGTYTTGDDTVAEFSNRGSASRGVDLVAPGRSLVSLRAPGSFIDELHPEGRFDDGRFRGSGTSQATAVVAAAAALVLEANPHYTPDDVKWVLTRTAKRLPLADRHAQGAGALDIHRAVRTRVPAGVDTTQRWERGTGTGSLDAARGTYRVEHDGVVLDGERDIFGTPWDGVSWSDAAWSGVSWSGGTWNGVSWSGVSWSSTTVT